MTTSEIRAEISVKNIEFEHAMELGLPHSDLVVIYRAIKELQYQLVFADLRERESSSTHGPTNLQVVIE